MLKAGLVPTKPRYVPRLFCAIPGLFGKEAVEFPPVEGIEAQQFRRAAILQHQLSRAVTRLLAHRRTTIKDLAAELDFDYARLVKLLRGHVPMRFSDAGALCEVLGIEVRFSVAEPGSPSRPT